ncbi:hypothetical protein HanPI659440_Chr15g0595431 [Helianthus annuus]|nr:hypothetical protein HanPI659440_Chr15g0595431 [Helianthus annuus]
MVFNWPSKYISSFNYFSRVLFIVLQMFCLFPMNNIFFHMYMITIGLLIALCSTLMGSLLPHVNNCYFILDVTYAVLYIDLIIGLTEICFEPGHHEYRLKWAKSDFQLFNYFQLIPWPVRKSWHVR